MQLKLSVTEHGFTDSAGGARGERYGASGISGLWTGFCTILGLCKGLCTAATGGGGNCGAKAVDAVFAAAAGSLNPLGGPRLGIRNNYFAAIACKQ